MNYLENIKFNNELIKTYKKTISSSFINSKFKIFELIKENIEFLSLYKKLQKKQSIKVKQDVLKPMSCLHFMGVKYSSFDKELEYGEEQYKRQRENYIY